MRCDDEAGRLPINDKIPVHFQDFIGQVWFKILDVNALFKQMHLAFAVNSRVGIEHSDDDSGNFPLSQSLRRGFYPCSSRSTVLASYTRWHWVQSRQCQGFPRNPGRFHPGSGLSPSLDQLGAIESEASFLVK